jgi:hypothetical protein
MVAHTRKADGQSVRRGIEVRFRVPPALYSKLQAAADGDRRSVPNWIMNLCADKLEGRVYVVGAKRP